MEIRKRVRNFVEIDAIPQERSELAHDVQAFDRVARELRKKAMAAGIYAPQLPTKLGGLGLSRRDRAVVLEDSGRSFLGPIAMNCAPPDQPNMIYFIERRSCQQHSKYLDPLIRSDFRSFTYSMTCANSVLLMFMRHPRLFKPGSIANVQIVDTYESLEIPVAIGLRAFMHYLNRTLLASNIYGQI